LLYLNYDKTKNNIFMVNYNSRNASIPIDSMIPSITVG
jgi:hypothetical protein